MLRSKLSIALLAAALLAPAARADFIDMYADKLDMPRNKAPRVGHSKVVLIPVQIDFTGYDPIDVDQLNAFFTAPLQKGALNFNTYFNVASGNRFQAEVTVAPVVEYTACPAMLPQDTCTIPRGDISDLNRGIDFLRDIFRRAHDENHVDFSQFDANGLGGDPDGVVDGVMIVVNVPGVGIALPIEYLNNGANLNGSTGGAFQLDGVKIPYCAVGGASWASDGSRHLEYIILHEFSHTLGLADLYYEHPSTNDKYPSWGGLHFSLMGDYDYSEAATLPDAESRRSLGWQTHHVVSGTQTLTLSPAASGGQAVKLGMMTADRKEYFLAEVRGPAGQLDTGVRDANGNPTWGLALYHVDWSIGPKAQTGEWTSRMIYCLDCDPFHPFIRNLESSGTFGLVLGGAADRRGKQGNGASDDQVLFSTGGIASVDNAPPLSDTFRYVATNYYDGTPSGISIKDIRVNGDHTVTATFTAPAVADPCSDVICPPTEACVKSGPQAGNCQVASWSQPPPAPAPAPAIAGPQSGCASTSGNGFAGLLLLALLGGAMLRRRTA